MRKLGVIIILILVISVGAVYFLRQYFSFDVSVYSLFSPLFSPSRDIRVSLPQSSDMGSPFSLPKGSKISVFADLKGGLPRVLAFAPDGTLVTSLTSKGKVVALPDNDKNGTADGVVEILTGLNNPHGIVFNEDKLYVAESDKVVRYKYDPVNYTVAERKVLFPLPGGGRHFTRTIRIYNGKLYTSVGSSCNVCNESNKERASILVSNLDGSELKVFAKGLRNAVFFTFDSEGKMWATEMGRDFLGDNLPPDELNLIEENQDYGWPYCYGNKVRDKTFDGGSKLTYCVLTQPSKYDFPAHSAPLGLTFDNSGNLYVALHGSWNSSTPVGYKVVKLNVFAGNVSYIDDTVRGFLQSNNEILGRPVDLIFDKDGKLYISDDKAGVVYVLSR